MRISHRLPAAGYRLLLFATIACAKPPTAAPEGERAVVRQPVGPVPGVGELPSAPNPLGNNRDVLQEGRRLLVQYNCSGCHGGRAGGGMAPSLRDRIWIYGSSPDHVFNSIAEGRAHGMPAWGTRLTDRQIWALTAYVQSLRTKDEPEAPKP
ncbi:MAG: c-type cytochrome [Myxococcales bacterium]